MMKGRSAVKKSLTEGPKKSLAKVAIWVGVCYSPSGPVVGIRANRN